MISNQAAFESPIENGVKQLLQSILEVKPIDNDVVERLTNGDLSTGIGMLSALVNLGLLNSKTENTSLKADWSPSLINTIRRDRHNERNFIVSDNNHSLYELLYKKVTNEWETCGEFFYIRSQAGVGKTHFLSVLEAKSTRKTCLINVGELELEIEDAMRKRERVALFKWLLSFDILLLDDLHHAKDNTKLQRELHRLIGYQIDQGGTVFAIGNERPIDKQPYQPDFQAFLENANHLVLELPDKAALRQVLGVYFENRIPEDAANYLAGNVSKSVRQLLGAANQLMNLSQQTGTPINKDMARAVLPLPADLRHPTSLPPNAVTVWEQTAEADERVPDRAGFFREILASAENEEEQALALQIALGQRLRELREHDRNDENILKMETALSLLRDGKLEEALKCIA